MIETLRDEFLAHLDSLVGDPDDGRRRSQACVALYDRHLDVRFVPEFRARRVDEITTADLRRWLDKLRRTKLAPNTQRGVLTAASAMLRFAAKRDYIPITPAAGLDRDDRPPRHASASRATSMASSSGAPRPARRRLPAARRDARLRRPPRLRGARRPLARPRPRRGPPHRRRATRPGRATVPLKTAASAATVDLLPALVRELRVHRARQAALGIHLVRADALRSPPEPGAAPSAQRATGRPDGCYRREARARHRARPSAFARRERARRRTDARRGLAARAPRLPRRHRERLRRRARGQPREPRRETGSSGVRSLSGGRVG